MLAAALTAVVLGVGLVAVLPDDTPGTSEADVAGPWAVELALATERGLSVLDEGTAEGPFFQRIVALDAGQCVALIAASVGPDTLTEALLTVETGSTTEGARSAGGTLVHLAVCVASESSITVSFRLGADRARYGASTARYALLRGPIPAEPERYPRLSISPSLRARLDAHAVLARARARLGEGTPLETGITIAPARAVLLPMRPSTYAARRVLSGYGVRVPEIASAPGDPPDPFAAPTDVASPPTMITREGTLRLLAVIDAGALGSDCIALALSRLDDPMTAVPITRLALPSLDERVLDSSDPAIAIDVLCPADGLFGYGVPAGAGGDYGLEVVRRAAPEGVHARPFASDVSARTLPLIEARRTACAGGEAQACIDLATLARDGVHGAGTPRQALEPICDRQGGMPCALLAGLLVEQDPGAADGFERRACSTGVLDSCLRHAASLRRAGRLGDALRVYRFACDRGDPSGCTAVSTFAEWSIHPAVEVPDPEHLP